MTDRVAANAQGGITTPQPRLGRGPSSGRPPPGRALTRWLPSGIWLWLLAALAVNWLLANVVLAPASPTRVEIPYQPTFIEQVKADNVVRVTATGDAIEGITKTPVKAPDNPTEATSFLTHRPSFSGPGLEALLADHHVIVNAKPENPTRSLLTTLLLSFGPTLLLIGGFLFLARRAAAGSGGITSLGRSKARLYDADRPRVTFADVAGIEEAEEELREIVDFLRKPDRYQRLGGIMPKGVLLTGPPGTGKTLLARAVAGEAGVAFFSVSAAEFVEMVVGVGASRVRDLFAKARAAAPAIIFIDELDAIGRSRSSSMRLGGHDEQEQTLNQILTEMDGFDPGEGVIVLAATNRPDVLDSALLRPGRFDRRVMVQPPDRVGRAAILGIHTREVPLATDVDLEALASQTVGLVGADLRNLINEAALLAARRERDAVRMVDFMDALQKVVLGAARSIILSPGERERIAYHEGGHAILGLVVPGADPVRRVSIVPRGRALGVTVQSPVDDRHNYTEDQLRARVIGALGGRAAESLVYGSISTGAESDLELVTRLGREMVMRWGMSESVGPVNYATAEEHAALGAPRPYGEATAQLIDEEIRQIIDDSMQEARRLVADNRGQLEALVAALLRDETLDEQRIREVTSVAADSGSESLTPHTGGGMTSFEPEPEPEAVGTPR